MIGQRPPCKVHRCLMVYPDGTRMEEPRRTPQLHLWILANKTFHQTAALFVDGECRYRGRLNDEQIAAVTREADAAPPSKGDQQ